MVILLLYAATRKLENGQIAAVRIEDEATLKRVYIENDRMVLQPINTSYAPIILIKEEINSAVIEGEGRRTLSGFIAFPCKIYKMR